MVYRAFSCGGGVSLVRVRGWVLGSAESMILSCPCSAPADSALHRLTEAACLQRNLHRFHG